MGGIAAIVNELTGANDAPQEAAQIQANAAQSAADLQYKQWLTTNEQMKPWREAGVGALNQLVSGTGEGGRFMKAPTMADLQIDPAYAFRTQEGRNQLLAAGAAAGNYGSGNMGVALEKFGQDYASNEYANAYNRYMGLQDTLYNRLAGIAGTGQATTQQVGALGANMASNVGNTLMQGANASAQGIYGNAQNMMNMTTNMSNQAMSGLGTYLKYQQQQNLYNQMQGYGQPYNYYSDYGAGGGAGAGATDYSFMSY